MINACGSSYKLKVQKLGRRCPSSSRLVSGSPFQDKTNILNYVLRRLTLVHSSNACSVSEPKKLKRPVVMISLKERWMPEVGAATYVAAQILASGSLVFWHPYVRRCLNNCYIYLHFGS